MSTIRERKEANKKGRLHSVKTSFQQIFPHEGLAAKVEQAVHLVTPILTEGILLANIHVLRCIESGHNAPVINQVFFTTATVLLATPRGIAHSSSSQPSTHLWQPAIMYTPSACQTITQGQKGQPSLKT